MTFDKKKYDQEFTKKNYDRIPLNVKKGDKAKIAEHAKQKGFDSITEYIKELIRRDMNEENGKSKVNVGKIENQDGGTIQIG